MGSAAGIVLEKLPDGEGGAGWRWVKAAAGTYARFPSAVPALAVHLPRRCGISDAQTL